MLKTRELKLTEGEDLCDKRLMITVNKIPLPGSTIAAVILLIIMWYFS